MKKVFLTLLAATTALAMSATVIPHYAVELGYDHGWAHVRTPDLGYSYYFDNANMDGFHVGGNVQLDFSEAQHVPGLVIGLNYQMLAHNIANTNSKVKETLDNYKDVAKGLGRTNITAYNYAFLHTLQIPVRFNYTYQINNAWRMFAQTGPQVRLHLSFAEEYKTTSYADGKLYGVYTKKDLVSGNVTDKVWINGEEEKKSTDLDYERLSCFDMSWGFALGVAWKSLGLSFTYDLGMINLFDKDLAKDPRFNNQPWRYNSDALAVTLSYRIK